MEREYPHVYKTGAYTFFALCGFGNGLVAGAILHAIDALDWVVRSGAAGTMFVSFMTLRDMFANRPSLTQEGEQ